MVQKMAGIIFVKFFSDENERDTFFSTDRTLYFLGAVFWVECFELSEPLVRFAKIGANCGDFYGASVRRWGRWHGVPASTDVR